MSFSQVSTTYAEVQAAMDQVVHDAILIPVDVNVLLQRSLNSGAVTGSTSDSAFTDTDSTDVIGRS